ncbi:glycosyltransferase family 4 protein [Thermocoleostomius sinensis]|uniref:Glycosyltransferase family 4 protein n=1 Tax=Thermocoleostomius sinensis A174 TaxID=2016057 RepID=A0A9E9C9E7_9CYAN|nr:glycosyltransferase family 4 protein [Thermocoleostomius sinensis]WAL62599.1 glycosyltransferase family 4 protein [Thermocoleostomius sinensis A174]
MKIAVIGAKGLPPTQGGIEHYCAEIYPRMIAQGHSVDLFARSSCISLSPFDYYDFEGIRVISLPCPGKKGLDAMSSSVLGALFSLGAGYDIIHFHALGPALFTWLSRISCSAKIVVTCHGLDWKRDKWGKLSSRLIRWGEQAAVNFADELIVVSEELRSYFQKTYDRQTLYIPTAPARYAASDPTFAFGSSLQLQPRRYILFLGRLVPEKCPNLLLKAFQSLRLEDWKLVFVGGNSDTPAFKAKLIHSAGNDPNVLFTGELRGSQLAEIVRGAGLFVLPSKLEGLPLAMLEAMVEGIPVLASDILPHRQLLKDDRGLLFQVGQVDSCAASLNWAIQHPQEMKLMAERARQYVRLNYTWEQITAANLDVYKSLASLPRHIPVGEMIPAFSGVTTDSIGHEP